MSLNPEASQIKSRRSNLLAPEPSHRSPKSTKSKVNIKTYLKSISKLNFKSTEDPYKSEAIEPVLSSVRKSTDGS